MNKDLWEEICFILTETVPSNVSEQIYENKVIRVFEKLGWSQYKKELSVRESLQFGAANRMCPDIIIRKENSEPVCVIEIKKPAEDLNFSGHINQLSSYMRMLRMPVGILLGNKIKVYTEKTNSATNELLLVEEIPLRKTSEKGIDFIGAFKKTENTQELIDLYIQKGLKKHQEKQKIKELERRITSPGFSEEILEIVKEKLSESYNSEVVETVLENYQFEVKNKNPYDRRELITNTYTTPRYTSGEKTSKRTKDGMKIGAYVQKTFRELFAERKLTSNDIHELLNPDYSKRVLNAGFPVLRNVSQGREDHTGRNRYYREIYGGKYYLSAQWNVNHWDPFEAWLKDINRRGMP